MSLVHFRVDDRLVHGIIAGYWTNHLNATRIMVIDDEASKNEMVRTSLRMATPATVSLSVLTLDKAVTNILNGNYENQRVFVIAKCPEVFAELQKCGIEIPQLTMGNITYAPERLKIARTVSVNQVNIDALKTLASNGTKITSQLVPSDKEEDFMSMLKAAQKK